MERECFEAHRPSFFLNREEFAILALDMGRLLEPVDSKSQIATVEMHYINAWKRRSKDGRNGKISRRYIRVSSLWGLLLIIVLLSKGEHMSVNLIFKITAIGIIVTC